jgi:hypothetical protein
MTDELRNKLAATAWGGKPEPEPATDTVRETVLIALVAAVQEMSERYKQGGVFDVPAIASFVVDEIERAGFVITPTTEGGDPN